MLTSITEALSTILSEAKPVAGTETVNLHNALGRVLADDLSSMIDVPAYDNSAMDGYAVCCDDLVRHNNTLSVSQRIAAGYKGVELDAGTGARIFTGAPIPANADTVIMQEDTKSSLVDGIESIRIISESIHRGQHIRRQGQDIAAGSVVLRQGRRLQPQDIGLLASIGLTQMTVYRRLRVVVLSTGDELVEPGQALKDGQIYNSNRYTLAALLSSLGCEVIDAGIVIDNFDSTCEQLKTAAASADIIISSGGVSVGEEDHVKAAVEMLGQLRLWKLNIKPGKPLAFGSINNVPFFGLPGNPSSVFVTFCLLARPYLLVCQGQLNVEPLTLLVEADFDWPKAGSRQEYLRARIAPTREGKATVQIYNNQSSGVLSSVSWANALAVIPPKHTVARGDTVQVITLKELINY